MTIHNLAVLFLLLLASARVLEPCQAFTTRAPSLTNNAGKFSVPALSQQTSLNMLDPSSNLVALAVDPSSSSVVASSLILLAATEPWVQPAIYVLDPFLNIMSLAMLARVVLSWYPEVKITEMPYLILTIITEPLLRAVKGFVPPAFGVDITPVFWVAIFTFVHEILLGQQGLLTMVCTVWLWILL